MGHQAIPSGLSLIELLIVVALVSTFAAVVLTRWEGSLYDQAHAVARIVAADVSYARNLAVANDSRYCITFDVPGNRYLLAHSGTDPRLDVLPPSPHGSTADAPTQQATDLAALPVVRGAVELAAVQRLMPAPQAVSDLEFGPLGASTRGEPTRIWLAAGSGTARRYLAVDVDPATGLTTIGELQAVPPATEAAAEQESAGVAQAMEAAGP
jgi:prepilin-type N-terminal cleavage/methylation domain-containing protein